MNNKLKEEVVILKEALVLFSEISQKQSAQLNEANIRITLLEKKVKRLESNR